MYAKMKWHCNCCGKQKETVPAAAIGRQWRTCSLVCFREMEWRGTLALLGKNYIPQPLTQLIDHARADGAQETADALQFDESGRCNVCDKLAGGDRKHKCWSTKVALV